MWDGSRDLADLGCCTLGHVGLVHLKLSGAFVGTRHVGQPVLLFFSVYVCVWYLNVCYMCVGVWGGQKRASDLPELELLTVVS